VIGTRLLVVTADDYGLTPGVCTGILRGHEQGILSSTSALVVAPAFEANAGALVDSGLDAGVHLAIVGEDPPVLSAREIPTLVDRRGRLAPSWRVLLGRAVRGAVDPGDVAREWDAQLAVARAAGLAPSHLDTHQHVHLWPTFAAVAVDVARRQGVGVLRVPRSRSRSPRGTAVNRLAARLADRVRAAGLVAPGWMAGLDEAGRMDRPALVAAIEAAAAAGAACAEVSTHPGADPDPERVRYRWGYGWGDELAALCSPSARAAVERSGRQLVGHRVLGAPGAG